MKTIIAKRGDEVVYRSEFSDDANITELVSTWRDSGCNVEVQMDREQMIEAVVDNLEAWRERDASGFWDHVCDLERAYLEKMEDKELEGVYQESI